MQILKVLTQREIMIKCKWNFVLTSKCPYTRNCSKRTWTSGPKKIEDPTN